MCRGTGSRALWLAGSVARGQCDWAAHMRSETDSQSEGGTRSGRPWAAFAAVLALTLAAVLAGYLMIQGQAEDMRASDQADWERRLLDLASTLRDELQAQGADDHAALVGVAESPTIALFLSEYRAQNGNLALIMDGEDQLDYIRNHMAVVAYDHGYQVGDARPDVGANLPIASGQDADGPADTEPVDNTAEILGAFAFEGLALVNLVGDTLVATEDFPPLTFDIRTYIQTAQRGERHVSLDFDSPNGAPVHLTLLPAHAFLEDRTAETQLGWIVGLRLLYEIYDLSSLTRDTTDYNQVQTAAIRERNGGVVALSQIGTDGSYELAVADESGEALIAAWVRAFEAPNGAGLSEGIGGVPVITANAPFEDAPVTIVASLSVAQALAEATRHETNLYLMLIPVMALGLAAAAAVMILAGPRPGGTRR